MRSEDKKYLLTLADALDGAYRFNAIGPAVCICNERGCGVCQASKWIQISDVLAVEVSEKLRDAAGR